MTWVPFPPGRSTDYTLEVSDIAASEAGALYARRGYPDYAASVLTNFYPTYGPANDQVDPVLPVRRTIFQRVVPRYRLSTSETRDEGVGPLFNQIPRHPGRLEPRQRPESSGENVQIYSSSATARFWRDPALGNRVDILA
jgi:hypothetical protein